MGKMINGRPVKMWIDGKIFNIAKIEKNTRKIKKKQDAELVIHEENLDKLEHFPKLLEIKEENGKFLTNVRLPKLYYSKIRNLPSFNIDQVSEETKSKVFVPRLGEDGEISIHSDDTNSLAKAVSHIHAAISKIRDNNVPLQFVCIPCLKENIRGRFTNLKNEIISMANEIPGLHESIFMSPLKLHITIDVYALLDEREKTEAINALNDYKSHLEKILKIHGSLKLDITGLDIMNANIKKVNVLYANIKLVNETEEHSLQKIVNDISTHFYDRGLAKRFQENVKLHMTIINTKYRRCSDSPKRKRRRQSIDATKILEKFGDYHFGLCDLDSIHLSHISLNGEDGFYKPLAVINLDCNKDAE